MGQLFGWTGLFGVWTLSSRNEREKGIISYDWKIDNLNRTVLGSEESTKEKAEENFKWSEKIFHIENTLK